MTGNKPNKQSEQSECEHLPTLRALGTGSMSAACLWLMSRPTRATWTSHYRRVFQPLHSSTPTDPDKVYFFISSCIFAVDLRTRKVVEFADFCMPNHHPI